MAQQLTLAPPVRGEWVPMSYDEFLDWSAGTHAEWVDGKGIIFVSASDRHQWTIALLYELLSRFAHIFDLGQVIQAPFRVRLWPGGPHREPDVLFVATAHLDRWTRTGVMGAVDVALEVISDDSEARDLVDKVQHYAAAGVPEYLAIDPRAGHERFNLFRLDAAAGYQLVPPDERGRYVVQSLPGLWLEPEWCWQDPLPAVERLLFQIAGDAYMTWLLEQR